MPKVKAGDQHPFRAAVVLGVVFASIGMALTLFIWPTSLPETVPHYWDVPSDVWHIMSASHYMTWGMPFRIYEASLVERSPNGVVVGTNFDAIQYQAGPLLPILLAPVAFVGQKFNLGESWPQLQRFPSLWLIYGPYGMLISFIPFLYAPIRGEVVRRGGRCQEALAPAPGGRRRARAVPERHVVRPLR